MNSKAAHKIINVLTTLLLKYPRRFLRMSHSSISVLERDIIGNVIAQCAESDRHAIEEQILGINYVDRGPVGDEYHCLYSKISGVKLVPLSKSLLLRRDEHKVGEVVLNGIRAALYASEGEIVSLEFTGPNVMNLDFSRCIAENTIKPSI